MENFKEAFDARKEILKPLNECIIVAGDFMDENGKSDIIIAKNRDRKYKPVISIVKEIINGIEVCYFFDEITTWKEGINENHIAILNSALAVVEDEAAGAPTAFGTFTVTKDGDKILKALGKKNIDEAIAVLKTYNRGLAGHTVITNEKKTFYFEFPDIDKPNINKLTEYDPTQDIIVRTNHGDFFKKAGYTFGDSLESSVIRRRTAENELKKAVNQEDVLPAMRRKIYQFNSGLNMKRDTDAMKTTSQIMLNVSKLELTLNVFTDNVQEFIGVRDRLPKGYKSKIKINVQFNGKESNDYKTIKEPQDGVNQKTVF
jgi:hypothetical protein